MLVCLKQTFDTEERIEIKNGVVDDTSAEFVINPYDEYAVEEAIKLKEVHGGEITLLSVGPVRTETALRTALAMGADKAILVTTDNYESALDEFSVANILAEVIKKEELKYDLILCGYMSVDEGAAQIGPRLAELLDIAHVSTITKIEVTDGHVSLEKDVEGDVEYISASLPLLVTAQQGLNEPRYPSLPGIMKAKKKPLTKFEVQELGLDPELLEAKTSLKELFMPPKKQMGKILAGEVDAQVRELVGLLKTEAKVV